MNFSVVSSTQQSSQVKSSKVRFDMIESAKKQIDLFWFGFLSSPVVVSWFGGGLCRKQQTKINEDILRDDGQSAGSSTISR